MAANTSTIPPSTIPPAAATTTSRILPAPPQHQIWRPPPQETALPLHVQSVERAVDMNIFINQLDKLLSTPIETVAMNIASNNASAPGENQQGQEKTAKKPSLLLTKNIWENDQARKRDLSCFYNFSTLGKRNWLKNVLLEDSDSDSDAEPVITERDLKILLKIHKYRRKYQKRYHTDILNSQYTYFGAGLLSEYDRFPEHKKFILSEYGFTMSAPNPPAGLVLSSTATATAAASTTTACPVSPPKRPPLKRRRDSQRSAASTSTTTATTSTVTDEQTRSVVQSIAIGGGGAETHSSSGGGGNGGVGRPPSWSSSEFNNSPPYPYFAVPLVKPPTAAFMSTVVYDSKSATASVAHTVRSTSASSSSSSSSLSSSLARPMVEPTTTTGRRDLAADASFRWRAWRAIAMEDIPKAHTDKLIQRKYQSVVLKQMAVYCVQFLEQTRESAVSGGGRSKAGGRHGKKQQHGGHNWHVGLRPVKQQQQQHQNQSDSSSK